MKPLLPLGQASFGMGSHEFSQALDEKTSQDYTSMWPPPDANEPEYSIGQRNPPLVGSSKH